MRKSGKSSPSVSTHLLWCLTATLPLAILFALPYPAPSAAAEQQPAAQPVSPEAATYFENKIRPILAENCYSCHGAEAQLGNLRLDSRAAILKGGSSGAAIVPGDPDKSLLIKAVRQTGALKMPQGGKLDAASVAALTAWVKMGAPWPDAKAQAPGQTPAANNGEYTMTPEQRKFWSLQPVHKPSLPAVKDAAWCSSPIDRFVLAKLEARGLHPNPLADRRTLIRRVTYDLTGLPPTPSEVDAFVTDRSPNAWEKVVDRLLASPRYGERWARHWLDVARYADTKGYVFGEDRAYRNAYTYRDWVIRAFNDDLPYDQFVTQQLAADRLPLGDDKRPLAALGFLTIGRRFLNNAPDIIDDRIDVTMRGFEGMTVGCARCHDHKFDPIPTKDYYSLYSVFASSSEAAPPISPANISQPYLDHIQKVNAAQGEMNNLILTQTAALREQVTRNAPLPDPVKQGLQAVRENDLPQGDNLAKIEAGFPQPARDRLVVLRKTLDDLQKNTPPQPEIAMGMEDMPHPVTQHIFKRGNPGNQGDIAPRRFVLALSPADKERPEWTNDSGRLELARAITAPDNPRTARVFVNRVWLWNFGAGLVRTPSDFGKQGERPTEPELLDYLAASFVENGWSIKKLQRMILLSSTYRQSSDTNPRCFAADPENRLIWHANRQRLDLEEMRDTLLCDAGALDTSKVGGPSVDIWQAPFTHRRSVYGYVDRQNLPITFRTFDFASPDATSAQRFQTTIPQQALFLMNSPFAVEQARALAARPEVKARPDDTSRIRLLYYMLYGRVPDPDEVALGLHFLDAPIAPTAPVAPPPTPIWQYGYGTIDPATRRVTSFTPFAYYESGSRQWRGSATFPDPSLRYLILSPEGGHPGGDIAHAVIRRWTAPQDGTVSIRGTVRHPNEQGDGVEARIVSSRSGVLGDWTVHNSAADTNVANVTVQKGDTLDFVVDCRTSDSYDSFLWAPTITLQGATKRTYSARAQFDGPPPQPDQRMDRRERYAQALFLTNEFMYVD